MRTLTALCLGAVSAVIFNPSAQAEGREHLSGWGPFKFSMSRDDAIAAVKRVHRYTSPNIGYDTEIDGAAWNAIVVFSSDQTSITEIHLQKGTVAARLSGGADKEKVSQANCLSRLEPLNKRVAAKYGEPDGPKERTELWTTERSYYYSFADGGLIKVSYYYSNTPGSPPSCFDTIEYTPSVPVVPKNDF